jgi:hypothetical protein
MARQNLDEILKLAQVAMAMQEPQQRAEQQDLQTMLTLAGLMQQRQNDEAQLGLGRERMQFEQQGRDAALAGERYNADSRLIQELVGDPSIPWEDKQQLLSGREALAGPLKQMHDNRVNKQVSAMRPGIEATYVANKNNPAKLREQLGMLGIDFSGDAAGRFDWNELNQRTWPVEQAAPVSPSTVTQGRAPNLDVNNNFFKAAVPSSNARDNITNLITWGQNFDPVETATNKLADLLFPPPPTGTFNQRRQWQGAETLPQPKTKAKLNR